MSDVKRVTVSAEEFYAEARRWSAALEAQRCWCQELGPLSFRAGDMCRACERQLALKEEKK